MRVAKIKTLTFVRFALVENIQKNKLFASETDIHMRFSSRREIIKRIIC